MTTLSSPLPIDNFEIILRNGILSKECVFKARSTTYMSMIMIYVYSVAKPKDIIIID